MKRLLRFFIVFFLINLSFFVSCNSVVSPCCDIKLKPGLIPDNYDVRESPYGSNTKVGVSMTITKVRGLNEKDKTLTMEINYRLHWTDPRLDTAGQNVNGEPFTRIHPQHFHRIWQPDLFLEDLTLVKHLSLNRPPTTLKIFLGNIVRYSARLTIETACTMDFRHHPVDIARCPMELKSYLDSSLVLEWYNSTDAKLELKNGGLPGFDVWLQPNNCTDMTQHWLCFDIFLQRHMTHHLMQMYLPTFVFLLISWLTFLIPYEHVIERIGTAMVALLSLMVMLDSLGEAVSKVTRSSGLHIWMLTCILFIFLALVEALVVLRLQSMAKSLKGEQTTSNGRTMEISDVADKEMKAHIRAQYLEDMADKLDYWAVRALPCAFVVFQAIYWPWLLQRRV